MVTKPLTDFKENKVKGYVHWTVDEWIPIRELAKEMNVPSHWVIKALAEFVLRRENGKLEFRSFLEEYAKHQRVPRGPLFRQRNLVKKSSLKLVRCPVCNTPCTETHIRTMHPKLTPEVLARN